MQKQNHVKEDKLSTSDANNTQDTNFRLDENSSVASKGKDDAITLQIAYATVAECRRVLSESSVTNA